MVWLIRLGNLLGGEKRVQAMLAGEGISLILKSINVNFRRPVTFPDTVRAFFLFLVHSQNDAYAVTHRTQSYRIVEPYSLHIGFCGLFIRSADSRSGLRRGDCVVQL